MRSPRSSRPPGEGQALFGIQQHGLVQADSLHGGADSIRGPGPVPLKREQVPADAKGFEVPAVPLEEDFKVLETKLLQLKLDYDQYFLGSRPREPVMLRGEVQKLIAMYSNQAIQNTAMRFKFGSICSRYQAFKRQWTEVLRQIEAGTYSRHRFKADLHERERRTEPEPAAARPPPPRPRPPATRSSSAYVEACRAAVRT